MCWRCCLWFVDAVTQVSKALCSSHRVYIEVLRDLLHGRLRFQTVYQASVDFVCKSSCRGGFSALKGGGGSRGAASCCLLVEHLL